MNKDLIKNCIDASRTRIHNKRYKKGNVRNVYTIKKNELIRRKNIQENSKQL